MPQALPQGAYLKDISAHYNQLTIPLAWQKAARLPPGIWGRVVVEQGTLKLILDGGDQAVMVAPGSPALVPEGTRFRVQDTGASLRFYLEYHHVPKRNDGAELAGLLSRGPERKPASRR